jgi:hypothetical protein
MNYDKAHAATLALHTAAEVSRLLFQAVDAGQKFEVNTILGQRQEGEIVQLDGSCEVRITILPPGAG